MDLNKKITITGTSVYNIKMQNIFLGLLVYLLSSWSRHDLRSHILSI